MKNYKKDRRHRGCFLLLFRKSVGKNFYENLQQEGSGQVLGDFQAEKFWMLSQDWCSIRDDADVYTAASVWKSKWWRRQEDNFATLPNC
jgi:hypothetical protein